MVIGQRVDAIRPRCQWGPEAPGDCFLQVPAGSRAFLAVPCSSLRDDHGHCSGNNGDNHVSQS